MRMSDMRVRVAAMKVEAFASEIAGVVCTLLHEGDQDIADQAIEILYNKTRALRNVHGIEVEVFREVDTFLRNFNIFKFLEDNNLYHFTAEKINE